MFFFYRNKSHVFHYKPLISYKWRTYTSDDGTRYLVDSGTSPKFPAKLYSGRAINFNGSDQTVSIPVKKGTWLYKSDTVNISKDYIDFDGDYELGKNDAATYNNVIVTETEFTDDEINYLYTEPEWFLYFENGIVKSKVLSDTQLLSIQHWLPLCDITDSAVDLVTNASYSITNPSSNTHKKQISTGLQTCFWKRDSNGVPIGIVERGVVGDGNSFISTGFIPKKSEYFMIETVLHIKNTNTAKYRGIGIKADNNGECRLQNYSDNTVIQFRLGSDYKTYDVIQNGLYHICLSRTPTGDVELWVDGVQVMSLTGNTYDEADNTDNRTFGVLGVQAAYHDELFDNEQQFPLFAIHSTPQDPSLLYAKYMGADIVDWFDEDGGVWVDENNNKWIIN